jgi:hypothetical protein
MMLESLSPDLIRVVEILIGAGAVYGGIRADLRFLHRRVDEAIDSVTRAHQRIDEVLSRRKRKNDEDV